MKGLVYIFCLNNIINPTTKRVELNSSEEDNERINEQTLNNIEIYKDCDNALIANRIRRLNSEWDIERCIGLGVGVSVLIISLLGLKKGRKMFLTTGIVAFFVLVHTIQGWCGSVAVLRALGVRTSEEISNEKTALKLARGDFDNISNNCEDMLDAVKQQ